MNLGGKIDTINKYLSGGKEYIEVFPNPSVFRFNEYLQASVASPVFAWITLLLVIGFIVLAESTKFSAIASILIGVIILCLFGLLVGVIIVSKIIIPNFRIENYVSEITINKPTMEKVEGNKNFLIKLTKMTNAISLPFLSDENLLENASNVSLARGQDVLVNRSITTKKILLGPNYARNANIEFNVNYSAQTKHIPHIYYIEFLVPKSEHSEISFKFYGGKKKTEALPKTLFVAKKDPLTEDHSLTNSLELFNSSALLVFNKQKRNVILKLCWREQQ